MANLPGQRFIKKRFSGIVKACRSSSLTRACTCVPFKENFERYSAKKHGRARSETLQYDEDEELQRLRIDLESALNDSKSVTLKLKSLSKRIEKKAERMACCEGEQFKVVEYKEMFEKGGKGDELEEKTLRSDLFFTENTLDDQVHSSGLKCTSSFGHKRSPSVCPTIRTPDFSAKDVHSETSIPSKLASAPIGGIIQDNTKQEDEFFSKVQTQPELASERDSGDVCLTSYTASMYSENNAALETPETVEHGIQTACYLESRSISPTATSDSSSTLESTDHVSVEGRLSSAYFGCENLNQETTTRDETLSPHTEHSSALARESGGNPLDGNSGKTGDVEQQDWRFLEIPFPYFSSVLEKEEIDCLNEHLKYLTNEDFVPLCFVDYIYDDKDRERVRYHFRPGVIPKRYRQIMIDCQPKMATYFENLEI